MKIRHGCSQITELVITHIKIGRKDGYRLKKTGNVDLVIGRPYRHFFKAYLMYDGHKKEKKLCKIFSLDTKLNLGLWQGSFNFLDFNVYL